MAVPECASNEEIPRVANLSELDFHEEYFLKVPYSIWELVFYFTLPCVFTQNILLFIPIHIGLNVRTTDCQLPYQVCFSKFTYNPLGYFVE
jgi:hypothetical protein